MKKLTGILLSLALLLGLAACGGKGEDTPSSSSAPAQESSSQAEEPPQEELPPIEPAYLTGLEKTVDYPEGRRITGVMINNLNIARPQRGLSDAKILFEITVESGITRFLALFEDYEKMPVVGPIRSGRDQQFQFLIPSWGFFVHDGPAQNQPTNWMIRDYGYNEFDMQPNDGIAFRDKNRLNAGYALEHTEYTSGELITAAVQKKGYDDYRSYNSPIFDFMRYDEPARVLGEGDAPEIAIVHSSSYRTLMSYDAASGKYAMSMFNGRGKVDPTIDENNGEQLKFDNVIVLFAPMSIYPNSYLVKADYGNGGAGYYFNQGRYELIFWQKGAPDTPLTLQKGDKSGESLKVNVGTTYIAVLNSELTPEFYETLKAGDASNVVGDGTITSGEKELDD